MLDMILRDFYFVFAEWQCYKYCEVTLSCIFIYQSKRVLDWINKYITNCITPFQI